MGFCFFVFLLRYCLLKPRLASNIVSAENDLEPNLPITIHGFISYYMWRMIVYAHTVKMKKLIPRNVRFSRTNSPFLGKNFLINYLS